MVYRNPKLFDGTLAGYQFRLKRDAERPYIKQFVRSQVPFNQIEEQQSQFNSRQDIRTLFQTSWADGAFWNKPMLNAASINSYNTSVGIDLITEPGSLLPMGTVTAQSGQQGNFSAWCAGNAGGDIFVVGDQDGGNLDAYIYSSGSGTWSATTADFNTTSYPMGLCYSLEQARYVLYSSDGELNWMSKDGSSDGTIIDTGTPAGIHGSNVFFHFGRLFVYDGDTLWEVTDPWGTPAMAGAATFDDGMGPDWLNDVTANDGANALIRDYSTRLAISTAEGIYIVKNVEQEGVPTATLHRVDRSNNGTDIASPIGTFPPGFVVLDITYFLGSIIVSGTSDVEQVVTNNVSSRYPGITLYHVTGGSMGSIGSPLGYENPDEAPYKFAGTFEGKLFIGGQQKLWMYDPIRGGLHPQFSVAQAGEPGRVVTFVTETFTSGGDDILMAITDEGYHYDQERYDGPDNDSNTRQLDSNYFTFNIPAEQKTITHVTLITDGIQAQETWTVSVDTDDSGFTSVATFTNTDGNTTKKRITPETGYRFRYRIAYDIQGNSTTPSRVKGIVFHALQGELTAQWRLEIDGKEFRNIENQVVDPDTVLSNMETVAVDETVQTFVDEFKTTSSTHNVKVQSVSVSRSESAEIDSIEVVLVEDT